MTEGVITTDQENSRTPEQQDHLHELRKERDQLFAGFKNISIVDFSKKLIDLDRSAGYGPISELVVAHLLNIWGRFYSTVLDVDAQVLNNVPRLLETSSDDVEEICRKNEIIAVLAITLTRQRSDHTCPMFVESVPHNDIWLTFVAEHSQTSSDNLNHLNDMIIGNVPATIGEILEFDRDHALYPSIFKHNVLSRFQKSIQDYASFYGQLKNSPATIQIRQLTGRSIDDIESDIADAIMAHLRQ